MPRGIRKTPTRVVVEAGPQAERALLPTSGGRPMRAMRAMEVGFSKHELIELSGVMTNNLPTLTSRGLVRPAVPVTRGKRPIYTHGEVFKMGLMERMREVGVPYRVSGPLVDVLRAGGSALDEHGVWEKATTAFVPGRLVWVAVADGAGGVIWCWRPGPDTPRGAAAAEMMAHAPLPAGGFRSFAVLDVSELAQRIDEVARAKLAARKAR